MSEPKLVLVNHNVHGGAIMIINLFVLRLADNSVFGSKIGKSVQCLKSGLDPDSQSFRLVCFGKCVHYVGPRHNVTLFEMICFIYLQLSLIALCCASVLSCQGCNFCCLLCRHFKGLSHAFEISLYAGYCSVACTALLLLIFQCILKRLNAKWNNVGYIWLAMRALPYLTAILCLTLGLFVGQFCGPSALCNHFHSSRCSHGDPTHDQLPNKSAHKTATRLVANLGAVCLDYLHSGDVSAGGGPLPQRLF